MPSRVDATSTLPQGHGVYENTTFATSCAYDDPKCYAQCTAMATACGSKWFQWTSRNSYLTFTQSPTSFSTTTIISQSWAYSTSVVHEGEARITFEYASPIGKPLLTTTSVKTFYSMDRKVTRWTEPPPTCTPSAWLKCTKGPDCRACTVQGGTVEVLFWPPASKIASNGTHIAPTQGFPSGSISPHNNISQPIVTAMFGTHTLTSPSVYISFQTAYAINDCGQTVGKVMPGALLPMDPHSLFTMRAGLDYFEVSSGSIRTTFYQSASFDYNDFDGPVPPSAYTHQPSCLASGCYTIYPDYHPQLALPPQVRSMDPAWASCALDWRGSWDPPIALSKADAIATPTKPSEVTFTEPASPKSTIGNSATMTSQPVGSSDASQIVPGSSSTTLGDAVPLFTYSPVSPSSELEPGTTLTSSQHSNGETTASLVIQVTTILQIGPQPVPSGIVLPDTTSTSDAHYQPSIGGSQSGLDPSSTTTASMNSLPYASEASQAVISTIGQGISKAPGGGLAIAHTTITAGGDAITVGGVVYSAVSGDSLLIISDITTPSTSHSPTNAYEVLSEALGTATAYQTYPSNEGSSETVDPTADPFTSLGDPSSSVQSTLPKAVLDLDPTTLTATQYPSGTLQIGSQTLNSETSVLVIDNHTLSTASNALIFASTTIPFTTPSPISQHQGPTILTLGSTLLTAHQASSSGAVLVGSNTLVPGSSAIVTDGHTLSAAASGLVQDGSLVVPGINSTVAASLPSVQAGYGSELPSVVSGPTIEGGGGEAAVSSGEASGSSNLSSDTDRLRHVPGLSWAGAVVVLLAFILF
jgi:hypothetical protein